MQLAHQLFILRALNTPTGFMICIRCPVRCPYWSCSQPTCSKYHGESYGNLYFFQISAGADGKLNKCSEEIAHSSEEIKKVIFQQLHCAQDMGRIVLRRNEKSLLVITLLAFPLGLLIFLRCKYFQSQEYNFSLYFSIFTVYLGN